MTVVSSRKLPLRDYFAQPALRADLQELLTRTREEVTTSIGEVGKITGLSDSQLRYIEQKGLLAPKRSREHTQVSHEGFPARAETIRSGGQRRYSLQELQRLVIISKALERYSLSELQEYLSENELALDEFLRPTQPTLRMIIGSAEENAFSQYVTPRFLYYAVCLLLEAALPGEVGVVLPVRSSQTELDALQHIKPTDEISSATLHRLGRCLVGWHAPGRQFCAFLTEQLVIENAADFEIFPLDAFGAESMSTHLCRPKNAYLVFERSLANALLKPREARDSAKRQRRNLVDREGANHPHSPSTFVDPVWSALQMLWLLQQSTDPLASPLGAKMKPATSAKARHATPEEGTPGAEANHVLLSPFPRLPTLWGSLERGANSIAYSSPEFVEPKQGDKLLTSLLETVICLSVSPGKTTIPRWSFACLLQPSDLRHPVQERDLVVTAQTDNAPYTIGQTVVKADSGVGLSMRAYQTGRIVSRMRVIPQDTAVYNEAENARSAIAVPVEGPQNEVEGVLYVASSEPGASSESDAFPPEQEVLLRVMGKIIGELVYSYRARHLTTQQMIAMIKQPGVVEPFLSDAQLGNELIQSESDFLRDLSRQLSLARKHKTDASPHTQHTQQHGSVQDQPLETLSFIVISIDNLSQYGREYGDTIVRRLVQEVGMQIRGSVLQRSEDYSVYRILADRFYVMAHGVNTEDARLYAYRLHGALNVAYQFGKIILQDISIRVGVVTYDMETLLTLGGRTYEAQGEKETTARICVRVMQRLDDAINSVKNKRNAGVAAWDAQRNEFIPSWEPLGSGNARILEVVTRLASAPPNSQGALLYGMILDILKLDPTADISSESGYTLSTRDYHG